MNNLEEHFPLSRYDELPIQMKNTLLDIKGGVAIVMVNRPNHLNALNSLVLKELGTLFEILGRDENVKVIVLTGTGEKAFIAGGDIKEMATLDPMGAFEYVRLGQSVVTSIERMKKPIIAAVNGFALGGGMELSMACDFSYAAENAKFALPEVTLGVIPGFGGTQNLARLVGSSRAKELMFTGRKITAQKAKEYGLVIEVYSQDELLDKTIETANIIAQNGLIAVAAVKDAVSSGLNMSKEDGFRYERLLFSNLFITKDQLEGMQAFIEKRKPEFNNKH